MKSVQSLEGEGAPFDNLISLLAATDGVAAIDAPFSIPRSHVASAALLWAEVAGLPAEGRPFGRGEDLVASVARGAGPRGLKQYRACEAVWLERGLNVRSPLWNGPRTGAAFAVACMTLLHRHAGPVWPFRPEGRGALLVEAYPAAQLLSWGLKPTGYNGPKPAAGAARRAIIGAMVGDWGLSASDELLAVMADSADALDAVICAYAARVVEERRHPRRLPSVARSEGWVVVDEPPGAPTPAPAPGLVTEDAALVSQDAERRIRSLFDVIRGALEDDMDASLGS